MLPQIVPSRAGRPCAACARRRASRCWRRGRSRRRSRARPPRPRRRTAAPRAPGRRSPRARSASRARRRRAPSARRRSRARAPSTAARQPRGALLRRQLEVAAATRSYCALGGERAEVRRRVERVAGAQLPGQRDEPLDDRVQHGPLDEQPRRRDAGLARVVEDAPDAAAHGGVEVGVGEDDVRRLAAELEHDLLERRRREPSRPCGPSATLPVNEMPSMPGCAAEQRARRAGAGDDVDEPGGDAGLDRQLRHAQRRERRQLGRLHDDAVAAGERDRDAADEEAHRPVPGDDDPGHADRLAHGVREVARARSGSACR